MLVVALAAIVSVQGPARPAAEWELLGSRRVSFAVDRDVIDVGVREGTFNGIRIEVDGGTLEMYNIVLTFGNGDTWSPNTRVVFRQGSWTRLIDLPGPARFIRKIEFWYRSRLRRGQATVRVFGRSAGALGVVTPSRDGARGPRRHLGSDRDAPGGPPCGSRCHHRGG
jgi:hypothetical protein